MRRGLAALFAVSACAEAPLVLEVPPGLRWVVLVEPGDPPRSSGLLRWDEGVGLPAWSRPGAPLLVLGYTEAALAPLIEGLDLGALTTPLAPAEGCRPRLPEPGFARRFEPGDPVPRVAEAVPALAAPWLDRRCPEIDPARLAVDLSCAGFCPARVTPVGPCTVALDLEPCGAGRLRARFDAAGTACLEHEDPERWRCTSRPPALECASPLGACEIELLEQPERAPFEVATRRLFEVELHVADETTSLGWFTSDALNQGYATDLVVLEDRVLVVHAGGARRGKTSTRAFTALDLETLAPVASGTTASDLDRLIRDPFGEGAIGAYTARGERRLGRFDRSLGLRAAAPLGTDRAVRSIESDGRVVAVLSKTGESSAPLAVFDARTLQPRPAPTSVAAGVHAAFIGGGRLVVSHRSRELAAIGLDDDALHWIASIPHRLARDNTEIVAIFPGPRSIFALLNMDVPSVRLLSYDGELGAEIEPVDRRTSPLRAHAWPPDRRRTLVAGAEITAEGIWAVVSFVSERERFESGTFRIGTGPPTRIAEDHRGRLWLLLPWSAEVVRLTPR